MVSKRLLADVVLNRLNGGVLDGDSKITIRQAMFAIGEARDRIIYEKVLQYKSIEEVWQVEFECLSEIELEAKKNGRKWYVDLECTPLNLPRGLGIYQVWDIDCDEEFYIPRQAGSESMFAGLLGSELEGQKSYVPVGTRLNLYADDLIEDADNKIMVRMVKSSHDIDDRDDFMIPAEYVDLVTERAFQVLAPQVQMPADYILDNTSKGKM